MRYIVHFEMLRGTQNPATETNMIREAHDVTYNVLSQNRRFMTPVSSQEPKKLGDYSLSFSWNTPNIFARVSTTPELNPDEIKALTGLTNDDWIARVYREVE